MANRIFELQIADYFMGKDDLKNHNKLVSGVLRQDVVDNGHFNMELCLRRFAEHYRQLFIVVDYGSQQFIIELKLWHGKVAHQEAYTQLADYVRDKGAQEGYLLSFDFRREAKKRRLLAKWVEKNGVCIFDVMP